MSNHSTTTYAGIVKEVVMDAPGDYSAFVNGRYIGSRRTRPEAEELCDAHAYQLLTDAAEPPYDPSDPGDEAQYVERDLPHAEFMALLDYAHCYDRDPLTVDSGAEHVLPAVATWVDGAGLSADEAADVARLAAHVAAAYAAATEVRRAAA